MFEKNDTVWQPPEHTFAKLHLLGEYLRAWLAIVGQKFPQLTYVDGFAGPGIYACGEGGSPAVALKSSNMDRLRGRDLVLLFIEKDLQRFNILETQLARFP